MHQPAITVSQSFGVIIDHFFVSVVLYALHSLSLSGDCCFADMVLDRVTRPYRFNKLLAGSMCITPAVWHLSGIYSCLLMSAFYVIVLSLRMIFLLLLLLYSILVCVQCRVQLQQPD